MDSLPPELLAMIVSLLDPSERARYSTISRRWQVTVERHTFRSRLNLFGQSLDFIKAKGKFDSKVLEEEIKNQIRNAPQGGYPPDLVLLKDPDSPCKVFVVATHEANSALALLRTYPEPQASGLLYDECTIWEACRATSAATTFFEPITIGRTKQRFVDGAIVYNNPIELVHREARNVWPGDRAALLISIGTGSAPGKPFVDH
ncbi:MAG: hypothetical protein M1816_005929 [Peltula sp. TS41687]|nr:MAG: hypothetical protein M1816_005929 [Peltula sp. TS41687]